MTNMNRFSWVKHIFIFQQSLTINLKVQKHKRYVVVNCAVGDNMPLLMFEPAYIFPSTRMSFLVLHYLRDYR